MSFVASNWKQDRLMHYARAKSNFLTKQQREKRENNLQAHVSDRLRQAREADINMSLVRMILDANKGMSLSDAKQVARYLQTLA